MAVFSSDAGRDFDAIVVGSGPSGAQAAQTLVEAGCSVTLVDAGLDPEVVVSGVDEDSMQSHDAANLAAALAQLKCRTVAAKLDDPDRSLRIRYWHCGENQNNAVFQTQEGTTQFGEFTFDGEVPKK